MTGTEMQPEKFKYKLDFYYQQAIVYLITMVLYAGFRGTFTLERFPSLPTDPILYIIITFVLIAFVVLMLNKARDRKLIIMEDRLVFHNKFHEREIPIETIEWIYIGREQRVQTAGRSQVIVFKVKDRRRLFRIRVGRYEREEKLLSEMERIAERVPRGKRSLFKRMRSQLGQKA
jgi:hypothetical protein